MRHNTPTADAMASASGSTRRRLDSWKDVAEYLARDVRTVMRWAKIDGLPVHHIGGTSHRAVFAWADEIDSWLAAQSAAARTRQHHAALSDPPDEAAPAPAATASSRRRWLWPVLAAALILGGTAWIGLAGLPGGARSAVVNAAMVGTTLVAYDAAGQELWRYDVSIPGRTINLRQVRVGDVDGDDRPDVVAALSQALPAGDGTGAVIALNSSGRLLWNRSISDHYTFGTTDYGPTWFPDDVIVMHIHGEVRIAAAWHHHTWWPSIVTTLDRNGQTIGQFVNTGWIHRLNVTADGAYLLAAGVNNALGGAVLAVLDTARIDGVAPSESGSPSACSNCPTGAPRAYVLVPWSDVARPLDDVPPVTVQVTDSGTIELHAAQRRRSDAALPEIIVELSPRLELLHRHVSDAFSRVHRQMEETGALTHTADRCPWLIPAVRIWTPKGGWRDLR